MGRVGLKSQKALSNTWSQCVVCNFFLLIYTAVFRFQKYCTPCQPVDDKSAVAFREFIHEPGYLMCAV